MESWELTWDKIILKNEKLGSGAFAEVIKGKLREKPPGFEMLMKNRIKYANLDNADLFDVAVKRIPKFANEATKVSGSIVLKNEFLCLTFYRTNF